MAIPSRATLKSYFETGDIPTQAQFAQWIDAMYDMVEGSGLTFVAPTQIYSSTAGTAGFVNVSLVAAGVPVNARSVLLAYDGANAYDCTISGRATGVSPTYVVARFLTNDNNRPAYRTGQTLIPCSAQNFQLNAAASTSVITIQVIGYMT